MPLEDYHDCVNVARRYDFIEVAEEPCIEVQARFFFYLTDDSIPGEFVPVDVPPRQAPLSLEGFDVSTS